MPSHDRLFQLLSLFRRHWIDGDLAAFQPNQALVLNDMLQFAEAHADACERTNAAGHFTGSGLVTNATMDAVLLTHHRKLNKWLQLGGHADGDFDLSAVAMRECLEESGLKELVFSPRLEVGTIPIPFDLDIHLIPGRGAEAEHFHYDVRYLIVASDREPLVLSEESHALRWFSLKEARQVTAEPSMLRQFDKLAWLATLAGH